MSGSNLKQTGKRRALLVGATGLVGSRLLKQLAESADYGSIATLGRRAPMLQHPKITHHVFNFSGDWDRGVVPAADVLFCCLGTTIKKAGTESAFRALDLELVVSIAEAAAGNGTATYIVVSSVGADPDSGNFYLGMKGEMEQAVSKLGFERVGILRPSYLLGAREEFRPAERLGQYAARLIGPVLKGKLARYRAVNADTVAAAMIGFDLSGVAGVRILEGDEIPRLAS